MRNLLFILLVLFPTLVWGLISERDLAQVTIRSILANSGFESGTSRWTSSGGSFTIITTGGNLEIGAGTASWDPSASGQTLTSTAVNVLASQNGFAGCDFKTDATDDLFEVVDGSSNVLASFIIPASTVFQPQGINFGFPSSGTIKIRVKSQSNSSVIYVDECYLGKAKNLKYNDQIVGVWTSYALTIGATTTPPTKGTIVRDMAKWRRVGDSMEIEYDYKQSAAGSSGSGTLLFPLPSGYTINTSKKDVLTNPDIVVGYGVYNSAASGANMRPFKVIPYNSTNLALAMQDASGATLIVGFVLASSTETPLGNTAPGFSYHAVVPVNEFSGLTSITHQQLPQSWSGYHDAGCSWPRSTNTYADPTADAGGDCDLVPIRNNNFGTVASYASGADELPGITFTPSQSGTYEVCAIVSLFGSSATALYLRLVDGSDNLLDWRSEFTNVTNTSNNITLCGHYFAASIALHTLKVQSKVGAGTLTIASINGDDSAIGWTIKKIDQSFPAPFFTGNVISNSTTQTERINRATITNGGSCSVASQSGTWITSVSHPGTGQCSITVATGEYSSTPSCSLTLASGVDAVIPRLSTMTATSILALTVNTGGAGVDADIQIICMGPK